LARAPESGELNVSGLEGCLNLVQGHRHDGWLWSALIVNWCDAVLSSALLNCLCLKISVPPVPGIGHIEPSGAEAALQAACAALKSRTMPLLAERDLAPQEQERLASMRRAIELVDEALAVLS
jgi:hypothetical protein